MPDRENVIKAWECCNPFNRKCKECPYEKDCYHDGISRHMVADAIALLEGDAIRAKRNDDCIKECLKRIKRLEYALRGEVYDA